MANEITALKGDGNRHYQLLFLYPIATPKQVNGSNVVPTPSSQLPTEAVSILTTQEKTDLDGGSKAFEVISFTAAPELTGAQLADRAREIYAASKIRFDVWYADVYKYIGTRLNETA